MNAKFALKRLTASDLTFFAWHFRNRRAGNQKAINLNAIVLTGQLYPALEIVINERQGKLGIDLWIAGPDGADPVNLQRKIIKGSGYKNWRLDGEFVYNPEENPDRFNALRPGDLALFEFVGDLIPETVTLLLIGQDTARDKILFQSLNGILGAQPMVPFDGNSLGDLCNLLRVPESHPVWMLVGDEDLAEAAMGHASAVDRLLTKPRFTRLTHEELRNARQAAEEIGRLGEEYVDIHLRERLLAGDVSEYEWISELNPIAPYDFRLNMDGIWKKLEIKTTSGEFNREYYLSLNELREMTHGEEPYVVGRVYLASRDGAKLRYSQDCQPFGQSIVDAFSALPAGVLPNGVTIRPAAQVFEEEIDLLVPNDVEA